MRAQRLEFSLKSVANSRKHRWTSTEHSPPHLFGQSNVGYHLQLRGRGEDELKKWSIMEEGKGMKWYKFLKVVEHLDW